MNKKGFTLMEILAVLLILALVAMFAMPAIRQVRALVQHHQAKAAALKMVAAMRNYYQNTKGYWLEGAVAGSEDGNNVTTVLDANGQCNNPALSGIPSIAQSGSHTSDLGMLFACDYLSVKDFAGLPYVFTASTDPFAQEEVLLTVTGTSSAGLYAGKSFTVHRDGSLKDVKVDKAEL